MAHFAKIENNTVTDVIVSEQDFINSGLVGDSFNWVQCSYNNSFRGMFPTLGYTYDETTKMFYPPKPYSSWVWNGVTEKWQAPVEMPDDGVEHWISYTWNEEDQTWTRQPDPEITES
jgi:hypothetical protein